MLPPLFARPPADPTEERRIRRLAAARHAPASWLQRARIITLSWDGAQVGQIAAQLGCHPRTVYRCCTASTPAASTTWATCPARAGPGGCRSWSVAASSPWPQPIRLGGWSARPTAPWSRPMSSSRRSGPWMRLPLPRKPRASRPAAARSAASSKPRGSAGGRCAPGAAAATRTSPQKSGDRRPLHRPAGGDDRDLCRRARPGHPPQLPTLAGLVDRWPSHQGAAGIQPW